MFIDEKLEKKNQKKIEYEVVGECWECISHAFSWNGYPVIKRDIMGKSQCHICRYIYTLFKGEIPPGMIIRHTCDNRKCINPNHLIIGTPKENTQDKKDRGRNLIVHLNEFQKNDIVVSYKFGASSESLIKKYGITKEYLYTLLRKNKIKIREK